MIFAPLRMGRFYKNGIELSLVDGGVYDNQGTVPLLAMNCNLLLVSDACGQLLAEKAPEPGLNGLRKWAMRTMDILMERVRLANFGDLESRHLSGLLRGLMFLHMKAGLDADVTQLTFSQQAYGLQREPRSPAGVRKDFQKALAELRTDLDWFTPDESCGLMACGYKMATWSIEKQLPKLQGFWTAKPYPDWPFKDMLEEITSTKNTTERRDRILDALAQGKDVDYGSLSWTVRQWRGLRTAFGW
jgi:hypothetical protein